MWPRRRAKVRKRTSGKTRREQFLSALDAPGHSKKGYQPHEPIVHATDTAGFDYVLECYTTATYDDEDRRSRRVHQLQHCLNRDAAMSVYRLGGYEKLYTWLKARDEELSW